MWELSSGHASPSPPGPPEPASAWPHSHLQASGLDRTLSTAGPEADRSTHPCTGARPPLCPKPFLRTRRRGSAAPTPPALTPPPDSHLHKHSRAPQGSAWHQTPEGAPLNPTAGQEGLQTHTAPGPCAHSSVRAEHRPGRAELQAFGQDRPFRGHGRGEPRGLSATSLPDSGAVSSPRLVSQRLGSPCSSHSWFKHSSVPTGSPLGGPRRPAELWGSLALEPARQTWPPSPRRGPQMLILSSSRCLWKVTSTQTPTEAGPSSRAPEAPRSPGPSAQSLGRGRGQDPVQNALGSLTSLREEQGSSDSPSTQLPAGVSALSSQGDICEHFQSSLGVPHRQSTLSLSTTVVPWMSQDRAVTRRLQPAPRPQPTGLSMLGMEGMADMGRLGWEGQGRLH